MFTWLGVQALYEINHSPLKFTSNDRGAGPYPVPAIDNTGTDTITRKNVDQILSPA